MVSSIITEQDIDTAFKNTGVDIQHLDIFKKWLVGIHKAELEVLMKSVLNHSNSSNLLHEIQIYNQINQSSKNVNSVIQELVEILDIIFKQYVLDLNG